MTPQVTGTYLLQLFFIIYQTNNMRILIIIINLLFSISVFSQVVIIDKLQDVKKIDCSKPYEVILKKDTGDPLHFVKDNGVVDYLGDEYEEILLAIDEACKSKEKNDAKASEITVFESMDEMSQTLVRFYSKKDWDVSTLKKEFKSRELKEIATHLNASRRTGTKSQIANSIISKFNES